MSDNIQCKHYKHIKYAGISSHHVCKIMEKRCPFIHIFNDPCTHVVTPNWDDAAYMCRCYKRIDDPSKTSYLYHPLKGYQG